MNKTDDPRSRGFNYGAPSRAGPRPPIYYEAMQIARALSQEATKASNEAWDLEMAVRHVRLACTKEEMDRMAANLEQKIKPYRNRLAA